MSEAHGDRILPVDRAITEEWGRMNTPARRRWPTGRYGPDPGPDAGHPQRRRCRRHRRRTGRSVQRGEGDGARGMILLFERVRIDREAQWILEFFDQARGIAAAQLTVVGLVALLAFGA